MNPIQRRTQVSVFIHNRPGTMARVSQALARQKVNIEALAAWGETDLGVVRLIVDAPLRALHLLGEVGIPCTEDTLLAVRMPNVPGALNQITALLSRRRINVDYCYGSSVDTGCLVFFKVDNVRQAEAALKSSPLFKTPAPRKKVQTAKSSAARRPTR